MQYVLASYDVIRTASPLATRSMYKLHGQVPSELQAAHQNPFHENGPRLDRGNSLKECKQILYRQTYMVVLP